MNNAERIRQAVYRTVDAINDLLPPEQALEANDDLVLLGQKASLDSMGFVNFIVGLEEELERDLGCDLSIADLLKMQTDDDGNTISTVADVVRVVSERLR
jgi:acyl carrier protein